MDTLVTVITRHVRDMVKWRLNKYYERNDPIVPVSSSILASMLETLPIYEAMEIMADRLGEFKPLGIDHELLFSRDADALNDEFFAQAAKSGYPPAAARQLLHAFKQNVSAWWWCVGYDGIEVDDVPALRLLWEKG